MNNNWNRNNPLNLRVRDVAPEILRLSIHRHGETLLRFMDKGIAVACILRHLVNINGGNDSYHKNLLFNYDFALLDLADNGIHVTLRTIKKAQRLYNFYFV